MKSPILQLTYFLGFLFAVCSGLTVMKKLNCTPETQVQTNVTCEAYLISGLDCSPLILQNAFPDLYEYINGDLFPEKPSEFNVEPVEKFYNSWNLIGANISVVPPKSSSIRDIKGFEITLLQTASGREKCLIFNLNGTTLSSAHYNTKLSVVIEHFEGLYYFEAYSLPKPPPQMDKGNFLTAYLHAPDKPFKVDEVLSSNWINTISYRVVPSKRAVRIGFVEPPQKYNFTEFEVELWHVKNETGTGTEERVRFAKITQLTYTFNNVTPDGLYSVKVTPYDTYWQDNSRCLCKGRNAGAVVCVITCTTTFTRPFNVTGSDINYGLPCSTTESCKQGKGMICNDRICDCNSTTHYWNGTTCSQKVLYNELCNGTDHCKSLLGLACNGGRCHCRGNDKYWSGSECVSKLSYNQNCSKDEECKDSRGLGCIDGLCMCDNSKFWSFTRCILKISHGSPCTVKGSCQEPKGLMCLNGICECNTTMQFWDANNATCINKKLYYGQCDGIDHCQSLFGLTCSADRCSCMVDHYWSGHKCLTQKGFKENCTSKVECRSRAGLDCVNGVCICNTSEYWSVSMCNPRAHYGAGCSSNDACSTGLDCVDRKCGCKDTIWSHEKQKCSNDPSAQIAAVAIGTVLGLILVAVMGAFLFFKRRHLTVKKKLPVENENGAIGYFEHGMGAINPAFRNIEEKDHEYVALDKKSVMLVYTEDHPHHMAAIKAFANYLSARCKCDVIFAPWCLQEIMKDRFRWIVNSIDSSEYIIIINSMESYHEYQTWRTNEKPYRPPQDSPIGDIFLPAMRIVSSKLTEGFDPSKFIMACFEYTNDNFVKSDICPGGKYRLPKHFDELLAHIHQLNMQNPKHILEAVDLPSRDNCATFPEGNKFLQAVQSAGKYEKDNPNWFIEKIEKCDSGIDDDIPILQTSVHPQPMNDLSNGNAIRKDDSLYVNYPERPNSDSIVCSIDEQNNNLDNIRMDMMNGPLSSHDVISFIPPSVLSETDDVTSNDIGDQIREINANYMYNRSYVPTDEGVESEIESIGGNSV